MTEEEKVVEKDSGDGCTTKQIYLMSLNVYLKWLKDILKWLRWYIHFVAF
jgi:hypothetical protein